MRLFSGSLVVALVFAAVAACSASPDEESDDVESGDAELQSLALKCRAGGTSFDVRPSAGGVMEATLNTGAATSAFVCSTPGSGDAGADAGKGKAASGLVATCLERSQKVHPGRWEATITKSGKAYKATIKRGAAGLDLTLSCSAVVSSVDAGSAAVDAAVVVDAGSVGSVPTYADVAPILDGTCGGCHTGVFDAVEKVKKRRRQMIDALSAGRMPRGRPTWKDSPDGQKLLTFLRNSPELL